MIVPNKKSSLVLQIEVGRETICRNLVDDFLLQLFENTFLPSFGSDSMWCTERFNIVVNTAEGVALAAFI